MIRDEQENQYGDNGISHPEPAGTDFKKHLWLLVIIMAIVILAAIVSHLARTSAETGNAGFAPGGDETGNGQTL